MSDLVSVIIPTYNRAELLQECINSVLNQSYSSFECIVVDDGSLDNTGDVVKKKMLDDKRIRYVINKRTKGAQGARNTGISNATGQYLQFLDSDDYLHPKKLEI